MFNYVYYKDQYQHFKIIMFSHYGHYLCYGYKKLTWTPENPKWENGGYIKKPVTVGICNFEARSRNHRYRGNAIILWVSVDLVILHSKRMRRIRLSSVACLALPYFSTYKARVSGGENVHKTRFLYNFRPKQFILRFRRDNIINAHNLHAK